MKNLIKAIKNSIRKYPHSWRIFLAAVIAGVEAVMGQQFADNAKTNGGFVIWCIAQAFAAIAFVYLVFHTGKVGAGDPE